MVLPTCSRVSIHENLSVNISETGRLYQTGTVLCNALRQQRK